MHTTTCSKYRFFHHSDFSGDVKLMEIKTGEIVAEVPFEDLKQLVETQVMNERAAKLEQMEDDEIAEDMRREALERCATMDEGWAISYASDAAQCEQSEHPEIRKRAVALRKRAEAYAAKAKAYREILSDNVELSDRPS